MSQPTPPSLAIGVLGVGRVGAALGVGFAQAGHRVTHFHAISAKSIDRAVSLFPNARNATAPELAAAVDLVLLTVPDAELAGLVSGLAGEGRFHAGQIVLHTSGAQGLLPLLPAIDAGAIGIAAHPAMTFSGERADVQRLEACPFAITSAVEHRPIAEALVMQLGGEPFWIDDVDRVRYHAALAHASNHLTVLLDQAESLLRSIGVEQPRQLLTPLVHAAVENTLAAGGAALTGPVSRGDVSTVREHLAELPAELQGSYRTLARAAVELALRNRQLNSAVASQLREVLD